MFCIYFNDYYNDNRCRWDDVRKFIAPLVKGSSDQSIQVCNACTLLCLLSLLYNDG